MKIYHVEEVLYTDVLMKEEIDLEYVSLEDQPKDWFITATTSDRALVAVSKATGHPKQIYGINEHYRVLKVTEAGDA